MLMKRIMSIVLGAALILSVPAVPLAAENANHLTISVEATEIDGVVMVPARQVGEELGFEVIWLGNGQFKLDDGVMHTTVTWGEDLYLMAPSVEGVAGAALFSLGVPPYNDNGLSYVPLKLFEALKGNVEGMISYKNGVITVVNTDVVGVDGGWTVNQGDMSLEDNVDAKAAFDKATETLTGYAYEPIAVLATQVVAGTNYCVLCRGAATVPDAIPEYELVYIYVDLDGNAGITSTESIYRIPETDVPLLGVWGINTGDVPVERNTDVKAAVDKAFEGLVGASIEPVAYLGDQVVAGMNYKVLCRVTPAVPDAESSFEVVTIYAGLDGSAEITNTTNVEIRTVS